MVVKQRWRYGDLSNRKRLVTVGVAYGSGRRHTTFSGRDADFTSVKVPV
jgi:hypothetical protein